MGSQWVKKVSNTSKQPVARGSHPQICQKVHFFAKNVGFFLFCFVLFCFVFVFCYLFFFFFFFFFFVSRLMVEVQKVHFLGPKVDIFGVHIPPKRSLLATGLQEKVSLQKRATNRDRGLKQRARATEKGVKQREMSQTNNRVAYPENLSLNTGRK